MPSSYHMAVAMWPLLVGSFVHADPSWSQYVRAPRSTTVYPLRVLSTSGNVTNAKAILSTGRSYATLSRTAAPIPPSWPAGTYANASSYHAPNSGDGQQRTYVPGNAIDGDLSTFWNDDTQGQYPDILTITTPASANLSGITVVSSTDGVPVDFTVAALINGTFTQVGSITGNSATNIEVPFTESVLTNSIQITVTLDQNTPSGEFTRVVEVYPGLVPLQQEAPQIVVDFGQDVVGFPIVTFAGASSNNPGVRLAFSETTEYLTNLSDFTRSYNGDAITPGTDQYAVPVEPITWVDVHGCLHNNSVCADGLHGFRYVKIYLDALQSDAPYTESHGVVNVDSIYLNFTALLGTPETFTGWFTCSDTQLTQFWYDAAYTVEMCTDTVIADYVDPRDSASPSLLGKQVIFDGAKRDRDPYSGDLAVSARSLYLTHNASIAARNVLADLADHQRADGWIPPASINDYTLPLFDYPLYWVTCSYDYVAYTGDVAYAEMYYQVLLNVLNNFYPSVTNTSSGLLSKGLGVSSGYGDYAFLGRSGQVTYYNALYVLALRNAAQIATILGGHDSDATEWTARAANVSSAINANLWDSTVGAYFDSDNDGQLCHGQDGNGLSVLLGIANSSRATSALNYWAKNVSLPYGNAFFDNDVLGAGFSQRVYAFISYFEIQARFEAGMPNSAINEIKRLYGWMAKHDPKITFWEGIGLGGSMYEGAYTSAAHGWSTGVLPALTNYVLGVTPTGAGFKTWQVKPMPASLDYASGVVPTPNGPIEVNWTNGGSSQNSFSLTIDAPAGTSGVVSVPVKGVKACVLVDNVAAYCGKRSLGDGAAYANGYVSLNLGSGNHNVTVLK